MKIVEVPLPIPKIKMKKVDVTPHKITHAMEEIGGKTIEAVEHSPEYAKREVKKLARVGRKVARNAPRVASKATRAASRMTKSATKKIRKAIPIPT